MALPVRKKYHVWFFLILIASEIMLLDAKHIYLFTYLANTVPQFLIILVIGTFCLHAFRVLLQRSFPKPVGLAIMCLFTCSPFLVYQMSPLLFKTQCGLFPSG